MYKAKRRGKDRHRHFDDRGSTERRLAFTGIDVGRFRADAPAFLLSRSAEPREDRWTRADIQGGEGKGEGLG
jgi:hypothetical protein